MINMISNDKYIELIEDLKKTDIEGCITGSALWAYDTDISQWDADVDLFCYTGEAFVDAVCQARYKFGFEFASKGERWKWDRTIKRGMSKAKNSSQPMCTIKMNKLGYPQLNISIKPYQNSVTDVVTVFDQTCIMHGYDIRKRVDLDYRDMFTGDKWISILNPLREQDADSYTVKTWLRQTSRLSKYNVRGFDVSQATIGYIRMIDQAMNNGALFDSEDAKLFFAECTKDFRDVREDLVNFLKQEYEIDYDERRI